MDLVIILLWISICVVLIIVLYKAYIVLLPKPVIIYIFSTFKKGNFILIDANSGEEIIRVINQPEYTTPIVKISNQEKFFSSIYNKSELGLGESYMKGYWSSDNLTEFLNTLCLNVSNKNIPSIQLKTISSSDYNYDKSNIKHHYDIGNDFYLRFLKDDLSAYSCGFWFSSTDTLNTSQYNKANTIIKKLDATKGSRILDIGCGWGKIAQYISTKTGCKIIGVTISDEQSLYAKSNYDPEQVHIMNIDYRKIYETFGTFERIYSIGMFEHIRYENYTTFFNMIKKCLKPNGRMILHTIITFDKSCTKTKVGDNFVSTHIFPGGQIPCNDWILNKARESGLNVIHFEGFGGQHYARTLKEWRKNMMEEKTYIEKAYNNELILKYDYYFSICEAGFNSGMMGIGHYIIVNEPILSLTNSFSYS